MEIPKEILEKWKRLRKHKDVTKLMKKLKKSQPIISNAINHGECYDEGVFAGISAFYNQREAKLKELLEKAV